jgi:hypothetical protein
MHPTVSFAIGGDGMHTTTVRSKFALGDRVRFNSPSQKCTGSGKIEAIVIYAHGRLDYMVYLDDPAAEYEVQPGVLEEEIALLDDQRIGSP